MKTVFMGPILLSAFLVSCASSNYSKSVFGTQGGYSYNNTQPNPASLMITQKFNRPLYLVLNSERVKNVWILPTRACSIDESASECKKVRVMDIQTFVRRDLQKVLSNYFSKVEVIESLDQISAIKYYVGDVKIDDMRLMSTPMGMVTYTRIEMTWGFAIRPNETKEYVYSFAGTATSGDSYPTFEAGLTLMAENAIGGMQSKWMEKDGFEALRKIEDKNIK